MTTTARSIGCPGYTETMPRAPQSARTARGLVGTALTVWDMDGLLADGTTVVSELVANAVRHAEGYSIRVMVTRPVPDVVRIAVVDKSPHLPVRRAPGADEVWGRGLLLVEALTERWGSELRGSRHRPWGKVVWGELTGRQRAPAATAWAGRRLADRPGPDPRPVHPLPDSS